MEIGAVAQIGKNVLVVGKGLLPDPRHALAAHLGKARGGAVHPDGHEMAANAGHGARALGHLGAGVVRATRAKPGLAQRFWRAELQRLHGAFFGVQNSNMRVHAGGHVGVHAQLFQALGNGAGNQRRRQIGIRSQQSVGAGVGHGPFAAAAHTVSILAVAVHLVELAQHAGAHVGTPVVQLFLKLVFNDLALFFHHQNLLQAGGKFACELGFERPHHRHLVQANTHALAGGVVQAQVEQGLARVVKSLAAGHQAKAVVRALNDVVVEPVGADIGQRGVPLGVKQARFLFERGVGPADVHATGGHHKIGGHLDAHPVRVHVHRGAGFDNFLDGFHAGPHAREAAHGKGVHAQIQHVLHAGRKKQRRAAGLENMVALVRGG